MDIWISGANGYIGRRLWQLATEAGHHCSGIDVADGPYGLRCSLESNGYAIPGGATVVHLAAVSTDKACKTDPLGAMETNIGGTLEVLKRANDCRRFLFASSEWIYGDDKNFIRDEKSELNPDDMGLYAYTKYSGEQMVAWSKIKDICSLRFGIVYGPDRSPEQWSAVESIYDKVFRNESVRLGNPHTARRFIHVNDLCCGIIAAAEHDEQLPFALNLTGNALVNLEEIFSDSVKSFDGKLGIYARGNEPPSIRNADNSLAKRTLGWNPTITIRDYFQSLQKGEA